MTLAEQLAMTGVPASAMEGPPSGEYDVVINATPLGLRESDPLPMSFDQASAALVLDLVYGRRQTVWTRAAATAFPNLRLMVLACTSTFRRVRSYRSRVPDVQQSGAAASAGKIIPKGTPPAKRRGVEAAEN